MEEVLTQIKDEVIRRLKKLDPAVDIFFEQIHSTDDEHGITRPETYYFIDIMLSNSTVDRFFVEMGVLVDVAYHEKNESNTAYLVKAGELGGLFCPVFSFGDRHITVPSASHKVADHVLHTSFALQFRHPLPMEAESELMRELDVAVEKERNKL